MIAPISPGTAAMGIEIQRLVDDPGIPADAELERFARTGLGDVDAEVNLRIVDEAEGRVLNRRWRGRDYATNVLGFPADLATVVQPVFLGDVVLCAPVIGREARQQGKPPAHHWAHLVIHGILHLQGFDHTEAEAASRMESEECRRLAELSIPDPYRAGTG